MPEAAFVAAHSGINTANGQFTQVLSTNAS
jgi:hypothetical protein